MKIKLDDNSRSLEAKIRNLQYRKVEVLDKHYQKLREEIENLSKGEIKDYLSQLLEEEYRKHYPRVRN